ncbi:MAG: ribonuclease R [Pseudomonadota bacterium]
MSNKRPSRRHHRQSQSNRSGLPERERIVDYLTGTDRPCDLDTIAYAFELQTARELRRLEQRLGAMERDGIVLRNRRGAYGLIKRMDLTQGRVVGHRDGYGFVVPDDGDGGDLFLSAREMRTVLHGDRVVVRTSGLDNRGRRQGELVEILERANDSVVGRYFRDRGIGVVVPDNQRLFQEILIPPGEDAGARDGDIVVVTITEQPTKRSQPIGHVADVLGDEMSPAMAIEIAIRSHDIPNEWPDAVTKAAEKVPMQVRPAAIADRVDLRELPLVTIDGADAKDFDDAVYCTRTGDNFRLWVAIADVSAYVPIDGPIDVQAQARGTSVYFPGRVVPMLPERLSNGICSLNPNVDRLCIACEMTINPQGRIVRSRFVEAVMCSAARLTYDEVTEVLENDEVDEDNRAAPLRAELMALHELYDVLRAARERRGAIEFDTPEVMIMFSPDGTVDRIEPRHRSVSHCIIEECMIAANIAAGRYLGRQRMPALYRVHEGPPADKLVELREFLRSLGLTLGGGEKPTSADFARLSDEATARDDQHVIQTVLLRSLPQAVYQPKNLGHFGLALDTYCHFTSPIRRYPDLLVHRAIRHRIQGGSWETYDYTMADMESLGRHTSMTERRADDATRDAAQWLKCEYMRDHVGETYPGVVSGVTSFGLFVMLDGVYVDGLVHVSELGRDYFEYDAQERALIGERSRAAYRLGDRLKVQVARVDPDARRIDFVLAESKERRKGGKGRRPRRRSRGKFGG